MSKWPPKAPSKPIFYDSIYHMNIFKTSISLKNFFVKDRFGHMRGCTEQRGESILSVLYHSCQPCQEQYINVA